MTSSPARVLVIGVGNRDRGDDAVGPIVCDLLDEQRSPGIETAVYEGSVLDLALEWQPEDHVVIVDASAPADRPGRVVSVDGLAQRLKSPGVVSTHAIDVGSAIELARALDCLPAGLTIVGIEGDRFDFGTALTAEVARAVDQVVSEIIRLGHRPADVASSVAAS